MSMEWFDRVSGELQEHLESICEKYDQVGHMSIDRGAKHPRIEFFVEDEANEEREYFCTLCFDPYNVEFYIEAFDYEYEQISRTILSDIEEIIDAVHESFHLYMNDEGDEIDDDDDLIDEDYNIMEEIDVEWETPEVTAFIHEDEVEVTYQFGVVQETGDGVLRRINRIRTENEQMIKDETNFIFSKEEASTIIAMIASHMDSLSEFNFQ
ncbi:hypothetical protein [Metabacillus malikii]|nr:hypothetical protein [Metabacillus malikii]